MKLRDLAQALNAELVLAPTAVAAAGEQEIVTLSPIATAAPGSVTFLANEEFAPYLTKTGASAIIVAKPRADIQAAQLVHKNPYWAFAKAAQLFFPPPKEVAGVSPQAYVDPAATVAATAVIYPFVHVAAGARIGERVVLYPGVYIGAGASIGDDSVLRPHVVIEHGVQVGARVLLHAGCVLGADGFGFAPGEGGYAKIPQVGLVKIGDDVEMGALVTVDRGALEDTVVGRGTKFDDHVHIGHGSRVGEHCIMCAYAGLAGSTKLGNWVVLGGHTGTNNRVEIADKVQVGAMAGVTKDLPKAGVYMGFPARPASEWRRDVVRLRRLGELEARLAQLEAKCAGLQAIPPT